jgi:hypothetical protein
VRVERDQRGQGRLLLPAVCLLRVQARYQSVSWVMYSEK